MIVYAVVLTKLHGFQVTVFDIFLSVKLTAGSVEPDGIVSSAAKTVRAVDTD